MRPATDDWLWNVLWHYIIDIDIEIYLLFIRSKERIRLFFNLSFIQYINT